MRRLPILASVFLTGFAGTASQAGALSPAGAGAPECVREPLPACAPGDARAQAPSDARAEAPSDSVVTLAGTVRAPGYRADGLLPGALIEVRQGGATRTGVADTRGEYRVSGLRPGTATVVISHLAAMRMALEVHLPARGTANLDLELERRTIRLEPLALRSFSDLDRPAEPMRTGDRRRGTLGLRALEATPGMAESGLAAAVSRSLGDGKMGEPDRALFMRGATVDARMVLLDGAPVLTPFHVAGLVAPFDAELMGDASLFVGGAPSRYQGGLSYLLDLDTREPRRDRTRIQAGVDGLAARAVVETPLPGGGGFLLGGRGLHGLQERVLGDGEFPYVYRDVLARVSHRPAPGHRIRLTGFENLEGVQVSLDPEYLPTPGHAHWGNRVLAGVYENNGGATTYRISGALSRYDSALPVPWDDPLLARAAQNRNLVGAEVRFPVGPGGLEVGVAMEELGLVYRLEAGSLQAVSSLPSTVEERLGVAKWVGHGEWEGEVWDGVGIRGGIRAEYTDHDRRTRVAPRAGVRVLLSETTVLRIAAGGFHQLLPAPGLVTRVRDGTPESLEWKPSLSVASASHLVVGIDQEIRPDLRLELLGFAKGFRGLDLGQAGQGRSRTSGVELRMAGEGDRLAGWLGYTLSWFWTLEGPRGSSRFDGRHLLSTGFQAEILSGLELGGTLGYGAGLPFAAITSDASHAMAMDEEPGAVPTFGNRSTRVMASGGGASPLEAAPPDDFLRLDLELSWRMTPAVGGRSTELRPYLRGLNALNRRDAMFFYFDRWRGDDVRPITERPFLPVLGVEWRF